MRLCLGHFCALLPEPGPGTDYVLGKYLLKNNVKYSTLYNKQKKENQNNSKDVVVKAKDKKVKKSASVKTTKSSKTTKKDKTEKTPATKTKATKSKKNCLIQRDTTMIIAFCPLGTGVAKFKNIHNSLMLLKTEIKTLHTD